MNIELELIVNINYSRDG